MDMTYHKYFILFDLKKVKEFLKTKKFIKHHLEHILNLSKLSISINILNFINLSILKLKCFLSELVFQFKHIYIF